MVRLAADRGLALQGLDQLWHVPGSGTPGLVIGYTRPTDGAWPVALETLMSVLASAYLDT